MRIFYFLFFTFVLWKTHQTTADLEDDDRLVIDTKLVEYDENEDEDCDKSDEDSPKRTNVIKNFVGTNLFGDSCSRKKCFSSEDVALLSARRDFESLLPKDLPNCLLDDELARILMQYFFGVNQVIDRMAGGHMKIYAQKAFYDTMGGYLKYYMLPVTRYSFYVGLLKLKTVDSVLNLYSQCKSVLNTNGKGWRAPFTDFSELDIQIDPIRIFVNKDEEDTSCLQLELLDEHSGEDEDMIVQLPRLDPEEKGLLGNIWLPFKRKRTFDLQSCMSAFVFLRYFELTSRCYYSQRICQDTFNKRLKVWILEHLEVHLVDETLYPGLGAILRVVETLRRNSKDFIIELPKALKRQKTADFLKLEHKANKVKKLPEGWHDEIFPNEALEKVSQLLKPESENRMKYIYLAIGIAILILLVVFLGVVSIILRKLSSRKHAEKKPKIPCGMFERVISRDDDEETGISSSSKCSPSPLPICGGGSKCSIHSHASLMDVTENPRKGGTMNDAAYIDTSSMDSNSPRVEKPVEKPVQKPKTNSGTEIKPKPKAGRRREIIVDEKKRFSISKKKKLGKIEEKEKKET